MKKVILTLFTCLLFWSALSAETLRLSDNLPKAAPGDYIITRRDNNYIALLVTDKNETSITIEETTLPMIKANKKVGTWREWLEKGGPYNTAQITYDIDLRSGKIQNMFSHTQQCRLQINESDNLFTTLLNLQFEMVPLHQRKKVGSSLSKAHKSYWQPKMISNGIHLPDVNFTPWRAKWPQDGTEVAGKFVLIYLPEDHDAYPSYFPYWMQVSGITGRYQIFIVDSGKGIKK